MSINKIFLWVGVMGFVQLLLLGGIFLNSRREDGSSLGNAGAGACRVQNATSTPIGYQESLTLLANKSNRAWARIQQPVYASNTVAVRFDEGSRATIDTGIHLTKATSSAYVDYIEFGLATDFPYIGEVTGITDLGTTSVLITECLY